MSGLLFYSSCRMQDSLRKQQPMSSASLLAPSRQLKEQFEEIHDHDHDDPTLSPYGYQPSPLQKVYFAFTERFFYFVKV
jgi:hypothetical protein